MNPYVIEQLIEGRRRDLGRLAGRGGTSGPIDAFLLTRPVLSSRLRPGRSLWRALGRRPPSPADPVEDDLRRARRLSSQLPLPADGRGTRSGERYEAALRDLGSALAAAGGTDPARRPGPSSLADEAARLRAEGVISPPAAEAVGALAAVLAAGAAGRVGDPSVEPTAAATAARLSAYLRSRRSGTPNRSVRSSSSSRSTTSMNVPPAASTARCLR